MGHLEAQLESWKQAEQSLESQVSQQAETVAALRAEEARAIHDEQVAAVVWWDCKMLMCIMIVFSITFCIYSSRGAKPSFNAAEQSPPLRRARPQPEFIEKDAQQEVEDMLQVTLPHQPHPQHGDLEAPTPTHVAKDWCTTTFDQSHKQVEPPEEFSDSDKKRGSTCQFFSMDDEPEAQAVNEDAWWNESAGAGY